MKPDKSLPPLLPNHALRQLRDAVDLTQVEFGERVKMSKPYIQAVEQGNRKANEKLALLSMAEFGVWHECILHHATEAIDVFGRPYTPLTWEKFQESRPEELTPDQLKDYLQPFAELFQAATVTGRVRVIALLLAENMSLLWGANGIKNGFRRMREKEAKVTEYTFGRLRSDSITAGALGFEDDPSRKDEEIAYRLESVVKKTSPELTPVYLDAIEIVKRAMGRLAHHPNHQNVNEGASKKKVKAN